MKQVVAVLLCAFAGAALAADTHLHFDIGAPKFNAYPVSNRVVTLQRLTPFPGNTISYTSDITGSLYVSNQYAGDFAGAIKAKGNAGEIQFHLTLTSNDVGVVEADTVTSVGGVQTYPVAGRSAWSIQASEQRYVRVGAAGFVQTNISYTAVTNDPWIENGQTGADLPALTSTNPVLSAPRIFDLSSGFPQPGVLMLLPDGTLNQRTQPPGLDLGLATNLPFSGLSDAAKTAITNAASGITAITATNAAKTAILDPARIYNVRDFGASNNAVAVQDCWMTNGVQTLTTAYGTFSAADVGKVITIWYAGATNRNLTTFITNVTSATVCTLSNAPSVNVTNETAIYGWDDTVYIQATMNYAATNGGGKIFFPGYSIIAGPILDTGAWATHHNSQLYFPDIPEPIASQCAVVTFEGPTPMGNASSPTVFDRQSLFGGGIISTLPYADGANLPSVLDCRNWNTPVTYNGQVRTIKFNALRVDFKNFGFQVCFDNNLRCLNVEGAIESVDEEVFVTCGYDISAPKYTPVGTNGYAVVMPGQFNNNHNIFSRSRIGCGFFNGISAAENLRLVDTLIIYAENGLLFENGTSGPSYVRDVIFQECSNSIVVAPYLTKLSGNMTAIHQIRTNTTLCYDPGNALVGKILVERAGQPNIMANPLPVIGAQEVFEQIPHAVGYASRQQKRLEISANHSTGNTISIGADTGSNILTAAHAKAGWFGFSRYGDTNYDYASFLGIKSVSTGEVDLDLGGGNGTKFGATDIRFWTAPNDSTAPTLRWGLTTDGTFRPFSTYALGTGALPIGTVTATQVVSSLFTGNGANLTNLNGSSIASGTIAAARLGTGSGGSTRFLREDQSWQVIPGGGDALTTNNLSQFAATTSAQFAGVISDETGSQKVVFNNSPTLTNVTAHASGQEALVLSDGFLSTNRTTGGWIKGTNHTLTLGPTNSSATITLDGSSGAASVTTVSASGQISAGTLVGDGSGATNLNAANIASGTLAEARSAHTLTNVTLKGTTTFQTDAGADDMIITVTPSRLTFNSATDPTTDAYIENGGFNGSGAGLTSISAENLTPGGTLPPLNGVNLTNLPGGAGVTGMQTNQFTTNVVGAEIVGGLGFAGTTNSGPAYYTNSAGWVRIWGDSVLASNRLTGISSYYTNGVTIYTNATTGASNVMSAAGWDTRNGISTNGGMRIVAGNLRMNDSNIRIGAAGAFEFYNTAAAMEALTVTQRRQYHNATEFNANSAYQFRFTQYLGTGDGDGASSLNADLGYKRGAAGVLEINSGTAGVYRDLLARNGVFTNTITGTNGVIVSSNSWVNQPTLAEGQAAFLSSNGVPHVVWKVGGVLTTNNLNAPLALNLIGYVAAANGGVGDIAGTGLVKVNGAGTPATLATPSTDYVIPSDVYNAVRTNESRVTTHSGTAYFNNANITNATFENLTTTNLHVQHLTFATNSGGYGVLDLTIPAQNIVTNNNINFTGYTFSAGNTNIDSTLICATNTSGSVKTFVLDGMVGGQKTYQWTNQIMVGVKRWPAMGTNSFVYYIN